jgi:hypothetical protein
VFHADDALEVLGVNITGHVSVIAFTRTGFPTPRIYLDETDSPQAAFSFGTGFLP